jgi:AcrR family transcriptional regulator
MTKAEPRRSDTTREAIRAAARDRFAADGFQRATIRAIAADAGIDPAMVMRYFGNKEGLFAAAVTIDVRIPDLTAIPRDRLGSTLAAHVLDRWEGDEELIVLLRSALTHEAAAHRAHEIFADQVTAAVATVVDDPAEAATRAGLVATQVLGLALARFVLRLPPVVAAPREELVGWLGGTLQRYLTGDPEVPAPPADAAGRQAAGPGVSGPAGAR